MGGASQPFGRVGRGVLLAAAALISPSPAAPAEPCLSYAPAVVDLVGVLQREIFAQAPIEDLFVDPNDPEVGGGDEGSAQETGGTPSPPPPSGEPATGAIVPSPTVTPVDPGFIGPMMPPMVDPVLLRARPIKRPAQTERVWVLVLRPAVCVAADASDQVNVSEKNVRKLQLIMDKDVELTLRPLIKQRVAVRGQLFHAVSRRHYLPVLVNVETVRPPEWIIETPPLPVTPR